MPLRIPRNGQFTITDLLSAIVDRLPRRTPEPREAPRFGSLMGENDRRIDYCTREHAIQYFKEHGALASNVVWVPDDPNEPSLLPEDFQAVTGQGYDIEQ